MQSQYLANGEGLEIEQPDRVEDHSGHNGAPVLYECGCCGCYHPWSWDGDCRDDANRYAGPDEYAEIFHTPEEDIQIRTMCERTECEGCEECTTDGNESYYLADEPGDGA